MFSRVTVAPEILAPVETSVTIPEILNSVFGPDKSRHAVKTSNATNTERLTIMDPAVEPGRWGLNMSCRIRRITYTPTPRPSKASLSLIFGLMRIPPVIGLLCAAAACSAPKKEAPPKSDAQVVEWAAIASAPKPGPENTTLVDLQVQLTVTGGWHVYSLTQTTGGPTAMTVKVAPPYEISGDIAGPPGDKAKDPNFGIVTETYSGEQIFRIPLRLASAASLNPPPIEVKIRSQACSDKLCLPARTTTLNVTPEKS